jgi:arsenate reductase
LYSLEIYNELAFVNKEGISMGQKGVVIYHNPRCGMSRKTLALLRAKGIDPKVIEYLKTPPSPKELEEIIRLLGIEPRDLLRKKEKEYTALKLDDPSKGPKVLIDAMVVHPILIERPIVVANGKAALGRPPENVERIL